MCIDEALLSSYLDGELTEPYKSQTEEHLAHCAACRARVDKMKAISEVLQSDDVSDIALKEREDALYERLDAKFFAPGSKKPSFFRRRIEMGLGSMVTAAAALVLVFIGGFVLFGTSESQTSEILPGYTVQADSSNVHFVSTQERGLDAYSLEEILSYLDSRGYDVDISLRGIQPLGTE